MKRSSLNHIYRTIWSEILNAWVAVSELVKAKGKRSGSSRLRVVHITSVNDTTGSLYRQRFRPILLALAYCFAANTYANPIGAQIVNGTVAISQAGNTLTVTNSPNAIINWQGFSIRQNEITNFVQQSAASSVLNRVVGPDPSQLLGALTSNGRVFLINPAGILVGQGARIDVAGFVASTLNLSNADFLAGNLNFGVTPNAGAIQNAGSITTPDGGTVYLVAPQIENSGIITTPRGETILAAGNSVQLIDSGTPGVTVQITGASNAATNLGQILADSGRIGMVGAVVKNSGSLSASSLVNQGGRIFLRATQAATVDAGSSIGASGTSGGTVEVLGNQVLVSGAIDASGTSNGGTILIGGDAHGANPQIQNAQNTFIADTATIRADGGVLDPQSTILNPQSGNGGKVVVWADNATQFNGNISAQGGALGGNGGWVEVSGKQSLSYTGLTNTLAANGLAGTLLLDPADFLIAATGGDMAGATLSNQLGLANVTITTALAGGTVGLLNAGTLGDITVSDAVTWVGATSLTLNAYGSISINAPISAPLGSLVLNAGGSGSGVESIFQGGPGDLTLASLTANALGGTFLNAVNSFGALNLQSGELTLGSPTFTAASLGTITRGAGTTVRITGTLDNTTITAPITLDIGSAGQFGVGGLTSFSGTILNGTLTNSDAIPTLTSNGGTLNGVIIGSNLALSGTTWISNGLALTTGITLDMGASSLYFGTGTALAAQGAAGISTPGTATLIMAGGVIYQYDYPQTLTLGTGLTVSGYGTIGSAWGSAPSVGNSIINNGIIDANVMGQTLTIAGETFTNNGTLRISGGNMIVAPGTWDGNLGAVNMTAGALNLGGSFAATGLGAFTRTGGTVSVSGTLNNTAATLDVGSAGLFGTGGLNSFSGTILNGMLVNTDAVQIPLNSNWGTLNGVTIGSNLALTGSASLTGAWSNLGTLSLTVGGTNNTGSLDLGGAFTTTGLTTRLGIFNRAANTTVSVSGTMNNTAATLDIGSAGLFGTGGLNTLGGTILNGTLVNTDTVQTPLNSNWGTLNGVTIGSNLALSGITYIANNLTLANGTTLDIGASTLYFNTTGAQNIAPAAAGAATVTMAGGSLHQNVGAQTLTLGTGLTVNGYGFIDSPFGAGLNNSIVNNGIINANVAGQSLSVTSDILTNNGTLRASASSNIAGGGLIIAPAAFTSGATGVLEASNGGSLSVGTAVLSTPTLNLNGGGINGNTMMAGQLTVTSVLNLDSVSWVANITLNALGATTHGSLATGAATLMLEEGTIVNNSGVWTVANGSSFIQGNQTGATSTGFNNLLAGTLTVAAGHTAHFAGTIFTNTGTLKATNLTGQILTGTNVTAGFGTLDNAAVINSSTVTDITGGNNAWMSAYTQISVFNSAAGMLLVNDPTGFNTSWLPANMTVNNSGLLNIAAGVLNFDGTYIGNAGSSINIGSGNTALGGKGVLNVLNGFTTPTLTMSDGTLLGSGLTPAVVNVTGAMNFAGAPSALANVTLNTQGATAQGSLAGGATIMLENGSFINNSGIWSMGNGSSIIQMMSATPTGFNNLAAGTLSVAATNTAHIAGTAFTNAGILNATNTTGLVLGGTNVTAGFGSLDNAAVITNSGVMDITGVNGAGITAYTLVSFINNASGTLLVNNPVGWSTTLPANIAITNNGLLDVSGGILDVSGASVNNGTMNVWNFGSLVLNGAAVNNGTLSIGDGGWVNVSQVGSLTNNGVIDLNTGGMSEVPMGAGIHVTGTFTNAAAGVINSLGSATGSGNAVEAYPSSSNPAVFGTLVNDGTVNVNANSWLHWGNAGSSTNAGAFNVAALGQLDISDSSVYMGCVGCIGYMGYMGYGAPSVPAGATYVYNGALTNNGYMNIGNSAGGTNTFNGTIANNGQLSMGTLYLNGTYTGGVGSNLAIYGKVTTPNPLTIPSLTISGGTLMGAGATPVSVDVSTTLAFDGAPSTLSNITLNAQGTTTQQSPWGWFGLSAVGGTTVMLENGASINNSGLWTMANDSSIIQLGAVATSFNNLATGTLTVATGNTAHLAGTTFTNAGTLNATCAWCVPTTTTAFGVLDNAAIITNDGMGWWNITGFDGANLSAYPSVSIINNGAMQLWDPSGLLPATTLPANVALTNNGWLGVQSGTLNLYGTYTGNANSSIQILTGGTLATASAITTPNLYLDGGTLLGLNARAASNQINVTNMLNFSNGYDWYTGTYLTASTSTLDNITLNTSAATLTTQASWDPTYLYMTGPAAITLQNGAMINNGGVWTMADLSTITQGVGAQTAFNNNMGATLNVPTGVASINGTTFTNNGLVTGAGTLSLVTAVTNTGLWDITGLMLTGTLINTSTGTMSVNDITGLTPSTINAALINDGILEVLAGTLYLNGSYTGNAGSSINVAGGTLTTTTPLSTPTLNLTGGTLNGTGSLVVTSSFNQSLGTLGNTFTSIDITQAAGNLAVGGMGATGAVNLTSTAGALSVNGSISGQKINTQSASGVTLNATLTASGTATAIVLDAGSGNFINNAGANALSTVAGRWLVYSADPAQDTFGGLVSNSLALWGKTGTNYAPASVMEAGNRYLFSTVPVLNVGVVNQVKTYGSDLTLTPPTATVTGLVNAALYGGVFVQDTTTGAASLTSAGFASNAAVNAGTPYAITVSAGTLATPTGYGVTTYTHGQITVNPFALTVTATGVNRVYDNTIAATVALSNDGFAGDVLTTGYTAAAFLDKNVADGKTVSVSGITLAGLDAANYTFNTTAATTANITPFALTGNVTSGASIYGDALTAGAVNFGNLFAGDALTATVGINTAGLLSSSGNLVAGAHAGIQSVTALGGLDAGNYTFAGISGDYAVTARTLTGTIAAGGNTYGAALNAGILNIGNAITGDAVSAGAVSINTAGLTSGSGNLIAGTHIGIQTVGATLTGADAGNYVFAGAAADYTVTQATLTVGAAGISRIYDATTVATVTLSDNRFANDVLTTRYTTAAFLDKNVGTAKQVDVSGITLAGTDAGNYTFNSAAAATANITPFALTGNVTTGNSIYGDALPVGTVIGNMFAGDNLIAMISINTTGLLSGSGNLIAGTHVGIQSVTALVGLDAGNYTFAGISGDYAVAARTLSGTIAAGGSVYGAALNAGAFSLGNAIAGDAVSAGAVSINSAGLLSASGNLVAGIHAGIQRVGATLIGADAANYVFAGAMADYTVTQAVLTVGAAGISRIYDATTVATVTLSDNRFANDVLTTSYTTAAFLDKNVGTAKQVNVSGITLVGADAGNYTFNATVSTTANISARPLSTWTGQGGNTLWNNPLNWDVLPDLNNVTAVSIPVGFSVTYDASMAGITGLQTLTSAGTLLFTGGTLNIGNALTASDYQQTGGSLTGTGNLNVTGNFSQTGGTITLTGAAIASITQAIGNLNIANLSAPTINLAASAGAIVGGTIPAGSVHLSAPSMKLTAATGIGSAAAPLRLVAASLDANTASGGGSLINTPVAAVTMINFTTNDASSLSYSQNGQALTLTGIMSSQGGSMLIDPPTNFTMNVGSSMSSGGGAIGLLATGNILLSSINAGTGIVSLNTSGGSIGSVLPAGQSNIIAGNVTASATTGARFAFTAPTATVTSTGGTVLANNLQTGATITNTPVVVAPVQAIIQQQTATTTAITTPTTTVSTTVAAPSTAPVAITPALTSVTTATTNTMPTMAGPSGGNIGGTAGNFGGNPVFVDTQPMPLAPATNVPAPTPATDTASTGSAAPAAESPASTTSTTDTSTANTSTTESSPDNAAKEEGDPNKDDTSAAPEDDQSKDKPIEPPEKC